MSHFKTLVLLSVVFLLSCNYTEKSLNEFGIKLKSNLNTSHDSTSSNVCHNGNHGNKRICTGEPPKQDSPVRSCSESDGQSLDVSSHHVEVDNVSDNNDNVFNVLNIVILRLIIDLNSS